MKFRKIKKSDDAVVGIIVALLLIGLILSVVSVVQTVFIPNWMKETEADHMDNVFDQFAQLKFSIDVQSILKAEDIPLSTPITLGSKNLPFMDSLKSFGFIDILTDECTVIIENSTNVTTTSLGIIKFSSSNSYYLDQSYIYESGAIITSQESNNAMSIKPSFTIDMSNIHFSIANITMIGNKGSASGYGTFPIGIEYNSSEIHNMQDLEYITIYTSYEESWNRFFDSTLKQTGFEENTDYTITETAGNDGIILEFLNPIDIEFEINDIKAQIAPGWIEI